MMQYPMRKNWIVLLYRFDCEIKVTDKPCRTTVLVVPGGVCSSRADGFAAIAHGDGVELFTYWLLAGLGLKF